MTVPAPARPRRLAFIGTPEMAVPPLLALLQAGYEVPLVVTRPDKRRGRRAEPTASPVKVAALQQGLTVTDRVDDVVSAGVDLGVVVAYGRILKPAVLDHVPMINLHFSDLPRWRGAAPVERTILAGDATTAVCVMAVEEGLDTGGVYARRRVKVRRGSTAEQLRVQLVEIGSGLLVSTLDAGLGEPEPQQGAPTYAEKLTPDDLRLDWLRPAEELARIVRVGGAWTTYRGRRFKVHHAVPLAEVVGPGAPGELHGDRVTTGEGSLQLREVQPEGRSRVPFEAWRNGARPLDGELLGALASAPAP